MSSQRKKSRRHGDTGSGGRGVGKRRSRSADPLPVSSEVRTVQLYSGVALIFYLLKEEKKESGGNSNNEKLLVRNIVKLQEVSTAN